MARGLTKGERKQKETMQSAVCRQIIPEPVLVGQQASNTSSTTPRSDSTPRPNTSTPRPFTSTPLHSTSSSPQESTLGDSPTIQLPETSIDQETPIVQETPPSYVEFMEEQRSINQRFVTMLETLQSTLQSSTPASQKRTRLPLKLTEAVRGAYKSFEEAAANEEEGVNLWDFTKSFSSQENGQVNHDILRNVQSTEKQYSTAAIRASIRIYFKSRKRKYVTQQKNKTKEYLKSSRARSRMNTKRLQRKRVLMDSTSFTESEKERLLPILKNEFMSSDESMSEESDDNDSIASGSDDEHIAPKKKVLIVKRLTWRSRELNSALEKMDRRVSRRRTTKGNSMVMKRRKGAPSLRRAPEDAPGWALNNDK